MKRTDVAAYIWPSYAPDPRSEIFWPQGIGEWESVMSNEPKYAGHDQPRKPLWGYVNESDPYVMEMQIQAAADHGVNVFIYDWYWYDRRPFLEGSLNDGYLQARNKDLVKFYLMWANHDANTVWNKRISSRHPVTVWGGAVDRAEFERLGKRLIERYFSNPSYYTIDGKPVFMIYELDTLISGLGSVEQTRAALDWLRNETVKAGLPGLHLQCTLRQQQIANLSGVDGTTHAFSPEIIEKLGFDSTTHYQFVHFVDIDDAYDHIMERVKQEWSDLSGRFKIPYYPHISIGWDNNPRFTTFRPGIVKGNDPAAFERALRSAQTYVDNHPQQHRLVTINSWNEWTETSYLQPCDRYGYGYLQAVRNVFGSR